MTQINDIDGVEVDKDDLYCLIGYMSIHLASVNQMDIWASANLSDEEWDNYQGLYIEDKRRYINKIKTQF